MKSKIEAYCDGDSPDEGGPRAEDVLNMRTSVVEAQGGNSMKTKTTHTPGPWKTVKTDTAQYAIIASEMLNTGSGDEPRIIAMCGEDVEMTSEDKLAEANAALIAAAPELLAALEAFYDAHNEEFGRDIFTPNAQSDSLIQKAWLLARAAIAKARGE